MYRDEKITVRNELFTIDMFGNQWREEFTNWFQNVSPGPSWKLENGGVGPNAWINDIIFKQRHKIVSIVSSHECKIKRHGPRGETTGLQSVRKLGREDMDKPFNIKWTEMLYVMSIGLQ